MADETIEQLAINTIRTLSMDAVQAAKSGHPGTPMALAPVAYVLWNEVLRYDPAQPGWPNRDRFVLSCGHASMLLYSVLHLAGVKQLDADGRPTDELAVPLDDIRHFRQLRQPLPRPSRARPHQRRRDHHRAAGPGHRQQRGHGHRLPLAGRPLQPAGLRPVRLQRLRPLQRRRPDGGRRRRGRLAGRPPQALQPLLDLRRQPHHHRGPHLAELQRGRGHAVRRLRLERGQGGRRQRPGRPCAARSQAFQQTARSAHADHRPQRDRLRRAAQGRHPRGPRGAAGRGGSPPDEGRLRLAGEREVPGARAKCWPTSARASARGARSCYAEWSAKFAQYKDQYPELAAELEHDRAPRTAPGWDADIAAVSRRRQGDGQPGLVGQGAQPGRPSTFPGCWAARPTWPPRPTRC